jgi:hypothetical protein
MKKIVLILGLTVIAVGGYYFWSNQTQTSGVYPEKADLIKVSNLKANDIVTSPLLVEGEARGYWYFEASFPVRLLDGNGREIAIQPAQAQEEWMTENYVPFKVVLTFQKPVTPTGTLVLQKDNPSGLPEYDDKLRIPVKF